MVVKSPDVSISVITIVVSAVLVRVSDDTLPMVNVKRVLEIVSNVMLLVTIVAVVKVDKDDMVVSVVNKVLEDWLSL